MGYLEDARKIKALTDENRLAIMRILQNGERCACVLLEELKVSQPTLSHHMRILCDSGWSVPEKMANGCTTPFPKKALNLLGR